MAIFMRIIKNISLAIAVLVLLLLLSPFPTLSSPQTKTFDQVWQTVNDNFYASNFNGVDWKAMRQKYQPQAVKAKSQAEFAAVVNQMLSELKTSHTHFYTQTEPAYYQLLGIFHDMEIKDFQAQLKQLFPKEITYTGIGIFTKEINGKTFINAILDGSPAAKSELEIGNQLLSVDGKPYQPITSFINKKKVTLRIQQTANPNSIKEIGIAPAQINATTMFLDAQRASANIIEREGKKIGYIHIWTGAGEEFLQQFQEALLTKLHNADALILDLRDGWGGTSPGFLETFTGESPTITSIRRDGNRFNFSYQWKKPVVMLVNQGTRSAKEILAFGAQKYRVGTVIGTKTAGAVVAGRPFFMNDGSLLYVAIADVLVDGKRLEGIGVTPDINVPFSWEYAPGSDPQTENAIATLLTAINQPTK